ncbi:Uncharacterised protein [Mycobacteroides abscessus subsp. abscessus]|uniref:hypothetical protein n=1 Tax=Mycobacteroides abscessus TaxID=36809 RepID=UPI00092C7F92|nr:hypothetical protein [Mycobacteroides abscessus]SII79460.1 Uncharacterised protein [Mycobacteroides abscessus subsp. abscessus]SII85026.1 Uncharacterised protein [Mycobacteroides abscessus subsp. abscessus]SIL59931.1 Uncharacterised protein [Mycobacteroides abscessus subsp. abscessus]
MSDPAISAARKVFTEYWPDQGDFEFNYSNEGRFGIEVAREMAKSVQELHRPMTNDELRDTWPGFVGVKRAVCAGCTDTGRLSWLDECETAKRVYPSEELDQ